MIDAELYTELITKTPEECRPAIRRIIASALRGKESTTKFPVGALYKRKVGSHTGIYLLFIDQNDYFKLMTVKTSFVWNKNIDALHKTDVDDPTELNAAQFSIVAGGVDTSRFKIIEFKIIDTDKI